MTPLALEALGGPPHSPGGTGTDPHLCLWTSSCRQVRPVCNQEENQQRHGQSLGSGNFLLEWVCVGEFCCSHQNRPACVYSLPSLSFLPPAASPLPPPTPLSLSPASPPPPSPLLLPSLSLSSPSLSFPPSSLAQSPLPLPPRTLVNRRMESGPTVSTFRAAGTHCRVSPSEPSEQVSTFPFFMGRFAATATPDVSESNGVPPVRRQGPVRSARGGGHLCSEVMGDSAGKCGCRELTDGDKRGRRERVSPTWQDEYGAATRVPVGRGRRLSRSVPGSRSSYPAPRQGSVSPLGSHLQLSPQSVWRLWALTSQDHMTALLGGAWPGVSAGRVGRTGPRGGGHTEVGEGVQGPRTGRGGAQVPRWEPSTPGGRGRALGAGDGREKARSRGHHGDQGPEAGDGGKGASWAPGLGSLPHPSCPHFSVAGIRDAPSMASVSAHTCSHGSYRSAGTGGAPPPPGQAMRAQRLKHPPPRSPLRWPSSPAAPALPASSPVRTVCPPRAPGGARAWRSGGT